MRTWIAALGAAAVWIVLVCVAPAQDRGAHPVARETAPLAKTPAEKKILDVLQALDRDRRGHMNVPREDGRLLRVLVEAMNAQTVVEIGTSNGYSALWLCLGLQQTGGRLITYEIDPRRAGWARANLARAGVEDRVTIVLGDAHETVKRLEATIDLLFLDADKAGYLDYLEKLLPRVRPGGLILSHNMHRPRPDPRFIQAITTNPEVETLFLNMQAAGMALTLKKR
ncbi:MAG: O-methyltransferase [Planctomycetota bacterium]|jgi:predicted O-methyltransferase YrrM